MKKQIWFDAREINPEDNIILPLIFNSSIDLIVVEAKKKAAYKVPTKTVFVVEAQEESDLEEASEKDIVMSRNELLLEKAASAGFKTCIYLTVDDRESLESSWKIGLQYDFLVIEFQSDTNIPLELVIARLQRANTVLLKRVKTAGEAEIAFGVMEQGSDGVLFCSQDLQEIVKLREIVNNLEAICISIVPIKVKKIEHIGMGYRACIDTTSILKPNEGMIIGSTSNGGILVSSETHYLPYMNLRPFRVNAGAVHSYVWCPGNTTEYITDLKSGSKVLVIDHEGSAREVTVGRIKIEMRPLLKITGDANGEEINTIVQDDWHIRVLGINGEPYNVTNLTDEAILAGYICQPGRHVGIKINENIIEK